MGGSSMTGQVHEPTNSFSLFQGGLLHRATRWLRFKGSTGLGPTAVLAGVLAFVPLVILTAMQDVLYGNRVALPLLSDWSVLTRFAIAVPLLILAGGSIDRGLSVAVEHFRSSGIVRGKTSARYESALADVLRSRDSLWPEVIILA